MKKVIVAISIILVLVLLSGFAYLVYINNSKPFEFISMAGYKENHYIEVIASKGHVPERKMEHFKEFFYKNEEIYIEIYEKYKSGEFKDPMDIRANITVKGGKTTVRYFGTVTTEDGIVNYDKSFTVDCVFTRRIPDEFKAEKQEK